MIKEKKDKKIKQKKPRDVNKVLTTLAIITTIVLTIVVSFFAVSKEINEYKNNFKNSVNTINKLNEDFNVNNILTNAISSDNFETLKTKCEDNGWDLFKDGYLNSTKYKELNYAENTLQLTENESGVLLNSILNISGNNAGVKFLEVKIIKNENSNRINLEFIYSFSFKSVLSVDRETEELLSELNLTLPDTVYAISNAVYDANTKSIITSDIKYNNLNRTESNQITDLLNAGKENKSDYIENYAARLFVVMNNELIEKTNTTIQFVNGGVNYVK